MGSIFYIKRNGQKYAYESTSVRVPGRKKPKTMKTYLGKLSDAPTFRIANIGDIRPEEMDEFVGLLSLYLKNIRVDVSKE